MKPDMQSWHEHNVNYTVMKNMNMQTNLRNIFRVRQKHTFPTKNWENETEKISAQAKFQLNQ